ncbi:MAG TPA: heterodisulfide reductase-related iron-sulfur binding cluster, partial [Blastocatellia bacterium]
MGLIHRWARLASLVPNLANFFTHAPLLQSLAKFAADVHPNRTIPKFASQTFKQWFAKRNARKERAHDHSRRVIVWADTFNNYFHPQTAQAAVEILETAGFRVEVPRQNLCCGRPLYDWGMLDAAKGLLKQTLATLKDSIEEGLPVVVLEPSCATVFREEMPNLFPNDTDARRLKEQTFLLSEFLEKRAPDFQPPKLSRKALVHGHCHHKSVMKMDDEESLLKKMGLDFDILDSGCCGMAGAFGFEKDHYDVAMRCGERVLLPAVRQAPTDAVIITDGFSCREQIAQATDRRALHLAEVMQMALHKDDRGNEGSYPETTYFSQHKPNEELSKAERAILIGAGALAVGGLFALGIRLLGRAKS